MPQESNTNTKQLMAWALYDWASSAFSAIILTFVYASYFVTSVAANPIAGVASWGTALGTAGLIIGIGAPLIGAFVDQGGRYKRWMAFWTFLAILSIVCMWFIKPSPAYALMGLILIALAIISVEFAYVFYNAMLPALAGRKQIGRWSGIAWALGYFGGMLSLTAALVFFVEPSALRFHLSHIGAQDVRATFLLAAAWYALFALPVFLFTSKDQPKSSSRLRERLFLAAQQLVQSFKKVHALHPIFHFLVARMIFTDALITLFAFGGIYAAAMFKMPEDQIMLFGIAMNIAAGVGALSFAYLDELFGSKRVIILALICLIVTGIFVLLVNNTMHFWIAALCMGLFVGPAQASSRAYLAKVAPASLKHQLFGMYALSSKVTSFIGPLAVGWVTYWSNSLRFGMGTIIVLLMIGLMLMWNVAED